MQVSNEKDNVFVVIATDSDESTADGGWIGRLDRGKQPSGLVRLNAKDFGARLHQHHAGDTGGSKKVVDIKTVGGRMKRRNER